MFAKASEGTTFTDITYPVNRAGRDWRGNAHRGVPLRAACRRERRRDRLERRRTGRPLRRCRSTEGWRPTARARPRGERRALTDQSVKWTQAWVDEVIARTGVHDDHLRLAELLEDLARRHDELCRNRESPGIAHWTKGASPLVPASNWNGLGWMFWQWSPAPWCRASRNASTQTERLRRRSTRTRSRLIRRLPVPPAHRRRSSAPPGAGSRLAGVPGTWGGGKPVAFNYQWQSCDASGTGCSPIAGANLETYTPTTSDVGHALSLAVTAVAPRGSAVASTAPTLAVTPAGSGTATAPAVVTAPQVTGEAQVGQTLTAAVGSWTGSPTAFAFQWSRCDTGGAACTPLPGATASSYVLTPGDSGTTLSLVVTATGRGGSRTAGAPTTAVIAPAPVPAAVPGPLAAQAGVAGAVVTTDGRATVTWQPGRCPSGHRCLSTPGRFRPRSQEWRRGHLLAGAVHPAVARRRCVRLRASRTGRRFLHATARSGARSRPSRRRRCRAPSSRERTTPPACCT